MAELGRKIYVKGKTWLNRLEKDEEGSTAVEFMGIAAVAVVVIMVAINFFDDGGQGQGLLETLFDTVVGGLTNLFKFK